MRKSLSLLLCLIMLFSVATVPAAADTTVDGAAKQSTSVDITVDGTTYSVGFYLGDPSGTNLFGTGETLRFLADAEPDPSAQFVGWSYLNIGTFIAGTDTKADDIAAIQVNSMTLTGGSDVFSFSATSGDTYRNGAVEQLYWRDGNPGEALVSADITITAGGTSQPAVVSLYVVAEQTERPEFAFYTTSEPSELTKIEENSSLCYYTMTGEKAIWLVADSDMTDEEKAQLSIDVGNTHYDPSDLIWDGNSVKITLPEPTEEWGYPVDASCGNQLYTFQVTVRPTSSAVELDGGVVVGIASGDRIFEDNNRNNFTSDANSTRDERFQAGVFTASAGVRSENGDYIPADDVTVTVNRMYITHVYGDADTFSFSPDSDVTTGGSSVTLYYRGGSNAEALLCADISITIKDGGDPLPVTVCLAVSAEHSNVRFYSSEKMDDSSYIKAGSDVCYYTLPTPGVIWVRSDEPFDNMLEIRADNEMLSNYVLSDGGKTIKITLPEPTGDWGYGLRVLSKGQSCSIFVRATPTSSALYLEDSDGEFLVGIASAGGWIHGENNTIINVTERPDQGDAKYVFMNEFTVSAGREVSSGGNTSFVAVDGVDITIHSMSIQPVKGDADAFSFSPDMTTLESTDSSVTLYSLEGATATALISADVTINYNGETINTRVSLAADTRVSGLKFYSSADLDEASRIAINSQVNYLNVKTIWVTSDKPFDNSLRVTMDNQTVQPIREDDKTIRIELKESQLNNGYRLNVYTDNYTVGVNVVYMLTTSSINFNVGDEEYVVGFGFDTGSGSSMQISEADHNWNFKNNMSDEHDPDNERYLFREMTVVAGRKNYNSEGSIYYDKINERVTAKVTGMKIDTLYGESDDYGLTFSFSQDPGTAVTNLDNVSGNTAALYAKEGYEATGILTAYVDVYVDGIKQTSGTVSAVIAQERVYNIVVERPENDTVEALNAALEEVASGLEQGGSGTITFILKEDEYDGTIVLPESLYEEGSQYDVFMNAQDRTTIRGGIDINGSSLVVMNMDFIAPEGQTEETRAIYGGFGDATNCTFQGYDVAIDADVGTILPHYCVFADNKIAARVDLANATGGMNMNAWEGDVFINNGTAVQVKSLNDFVSDYYFRIVESNFVNNSVTYDVRCPGTIYMYRNYYGRVKNNAEMSSAEILEALRNGDLSNILRQPPKVEIEDHSVTKVITNPRWKDPVELTNTPSLPVSSSVSSSGSGSGSSANSAALLAETQSENYLTVDWSLPTEIVNSESGLVIDASAFAEATEDDRVITIVDQEGNLIGTWNLGKEAHEGLTGEFNPIIEVTTGANGEKQVSIEADSTLLAALQPTLIIPEASGGVKDDTGTGVPSEEVSGSVSFTVTGNGNYIISEEVPETPTEPEAPTEPSTPTAPVKPSEPDEPEETEPPFTDLADGAWYTDAVKYVYSNGLMDGTSTTTFEPNANMTRAMVWAILARIDGETVTGAEWATDARAWAMAEGVSDGTDPNGLVTREQFVTMLYRYAVAKGYDVSIGESTNILSYADFDEISEWAIPAMQWGCGSGVVTGVTESTLEPAGTATRAQCAAMLMRFVECIK